MSQTTTSSRKSILYAAVGLCALLVVVSAFLPNLEERELASKRHLIEKLLKIPSPSIAPSPAIVIRRESVVPQIEQRNVRIHAFLKIGHRIQREDLLSNSFGSYGAHELVHHLSFDPHDREQLKLATALALAATDPLTGDQLRFEVFLSSRSTGSTAAKSLAQSVLAGVKPKERIEAERKLLDEIERGGATAFAPGTILYEVSGRFYKELAQPTSPARSLLSRTSSTEYYETLQALSDVKVPLP